MILLYRAFIEDKMGTKYIERKNIEFFKSFEESNSTTPIFFILSPGVNPLKVNWFFEYLFLWKYKFDLIYIYFKEVEELGLKLNFSCNLNNFHNVSLGQGQEIIAEEALDIAAKCGHWVVLQVN